MFCMRGRLAILGFLLVLLANEVAAANVLQLNDNPIPGMTISEAVKITEIMQSRNSDCRWRYDKGMTINYLMTGKGYTFTRGITLPECIRLAMNKPIGQGITRGVAPTVAPAFERKTPLVKPATEDEVAASALAAKRLEGMQIANVVRRSDAICRRLYSEMQMAEYYVSGKGSSAREKSMETCVALGKTLLGLETGTIKAPTSARTLPAANRPPIVLPGTLQEWQMTRIVDAAMVARIAGRVCRNFYNREEMKNALMEGTIPVQQAELIKLGKNPDILDCVRNGLRISNINVR